MISCINYALLHIASKRHTLILEHSNRVKFPVTGLGDWRNTPAFSFRNSPFFIYKNNCIYGSRFPTFMARSVFGVVIGIGIKSLVWALVQICRQFIEIIGLFCRRCALSTTVTPCVGAIKNGNGLPSCSRLICTGCADNES